MIFPFGSMQYAEAERMEENSYMKKIKETQEYRELSSDNKREFDKNLKKKIIR